MNKTLEELYAEFRPLIKSVSRARSRITGIDAADFESAMNEALWVAYKTYDPTRGTPIEARVDRKLWDALTYVIRSKDGSYARRVYAVLDAPKDDGEDTPRSEPTDGITAEYEALYSEDRKRADQRQLIDSLVSDPSKVDFDTVRAVSEFPQYDSITALAKALGMHHEVVKRKLRRLANRYDANRFGDVREYLAV